MDEERSPDRNLAIGVVVSVAIALILSLLAPNPAVDAVVNHAVADESHERACIAQYAAGERMVKKRPACVLGTRDVPADALPYPTAAVQASFWTTKE